MKANDPDAEQVAKHPRGAWLGRLVTLAKLALFALVCWSIYYTFVSGNETLRTQLRNHSWQIAAEWLVVSGACYLLGMFPSAVFWYHVLLRAGQQVTLPRALAPITSRNWASTCPASGW